MRLIKEIHIISLAEVNCNFEKIDEKLGNETEIFVGMRVDYFQSSNEDPRQYRAKISFLLNVGDVSQENDVMVTISHTIDFSSEQENLDSNNKELNFRLFEIVEPYVRYAFNNLSAQTKFSNLSFPYQFWELISDESK